MRRHTTVSGRVVYDRARHYFKMRDLSRISNRILMIDLKEPGLAGELIAKISQVLIKQMIGTFGYLVSAEVVYRLLLSLVSFVLSLFGWEEQRELALRLFRRVLFAIPREELISSIDLLA